MISKGHTQLTSTFCEFRDDVNEIDTHHHHLGWLIEATGGKGSLLEIFQFLEVGLISYLPNGADNIVNPYKGLRSNARQRKPTPEQCLICGFTEAILNHHIWRRTYLIGKPSTNGGARREDTLLGVVYVCPNHHYLIHQANPFSEQKRSDLYYDYLLEE